jgi:hypothetical protein
MGRRLVIGISKELREKLTTNFGCLAPSIFALRQNVMYIVQICIVAELSPEILF